LVDKFGLFFVTLSTILKKEPEQYDFQGEEKSNRFLQLLLRAVAEEAISLSKAAALNNQKLAEFRQLFNPVKAGVKKLKEWE